MEDPPAVPDYTLIFLHIPKTGGISLREVLLQQRARYQSFRIIHPIDDQQQLTQLPLEVRAGLGLVEGHLYYGVHEHLPRPCIYMTLLRDPLERVLSYYSFIREHQPHHLYEAVRGGNLSLSDCLERRITIELDNFMVRCLTGLHNVWAPFGGVTRDMLAEAKAHLDSIAAIGFTEELEESIARFAAMFGWEDVALPRLNASQERVRRDSLSPAEEAAIRECNALDQELYDYGRELWQRRAPQRHLSPPAAERRATLRP